MWQEDVEFIRLSELVAEGRDEEKRSSLFAPLANV